MPWLRAETETAVEQRNAARAAVVELVRAALADRDKLRAANREARDAQLARLAEVQVCCSVCPPLRCLLCARGLHAVALRCQARMLVLLGRWQRFGCALNLSAKPARPRIHRTRATLAAELHLHWHLVRRSAKAQLAASVYVCTRAFGVVLWTWPCAAACFVLASPPRPRLPECTKAAHKQRKHSRISWAAQNGLELSQPGIEPGSQAWKAYILTVGLPTHPVPCRGINVGYILGPHSNMHNSRSLC
jgi:hypothetical protein